MANTPIESPDWIVNTTDMPEVVERYVDEHQAYVDWVGQQDIYSVEEEILKDILK